MTINLKMPDIRELKPRITVFGVGGAGGNAVNNMIEGGLQGCDFVVANTDAQALSSAKAERIIQMGLAVTSGLGAGSHPEVGAAAAEEVIDEIRDQLSGSHMAFITAGMGGGTGTGAAPVIARIARELGILTVGVVTKPFHFEGVRRMKTAEAGIVELQKSVDTLIVIPNQNLFRVANERTTFTDAFAMADQVLYSGVACITDLMVKEGLINLDFADVRAVMRDMGKAMMGTGEATGERRAITAAEAAIANPLLDETSMKGARGLLISITGGNDLTLFEVDEAATRIREEVDPEANIILGATFDNALDGTIRVSVVATGIDLSAQGANTQTIAEMTAKLRQSAQRMAQLQQPAPAPAPAPAPQPVAQAPVEAEPQIYDLPAAEAPAPAAVVTESEVVLQPVVAKPALFREAPVELDQPLMPPRDEPIPARDFIPPAAEKPMRPVRMPTTDELPPIVRQQLRAEPAPASRAEDNPVERKRTSLMEKLQSIGFTRKPEAAEAPAPAPRAAPPLQPARPLAQAPRMPAAPAPQMRREPSGLDIHGRPAAQQQRADDEHLDIPAFLRRQAN
ncbi:cell division protein FtsZ [Phreatobacter cathodiphilus]|uniref:Cell division protein FtsZ n=1 Tax=Phreatobacter cathodiphilus TaxID=1868589 RepID=A0A2S0NH76_9HYPH|nr:cell division protein FtsZ [Phreatobacter cathodiphilus]AVO47447.1 cell division protein FtsZ [Phreatobacter cathodiphilus]